MGLLRVPETFPSWILTLDAAIAEGAYIHGYCTICGKVKAVDLVALRVLKGGSYSLLNRRTRCHLTEECRGWIKFSYRHGVMRRLYDEETSLRWMFSDMDERWSRRDAR